MPFSEIYISHDSTSKSSQHIRCLLEKRNKIAQVTRNIDGAQRPKAPVEDYLDEVKSAPIGHQDVIYELEVVDRNRATPDQWRTIGSFLHKNRQSQVEQLKDENGPVLVNWDDGIVAKSEAAAERMIANLEQEMIGSHKDAKSTACVIS